MTPDDRQFLKAAFQAVADAPLEAADPRYVALDVARGEDVVERLARGIEFSAGESIQLVTGFRGTGKTTELKRLERRLVEQGYEVVFTDADELLSMSNPVNARELIAALASDIGYRVTKFPDGRHAGVVLIVDSLEHTAAVHSGTVSVEEFVTALSRVLADPATPVLHVVCTVPVALRSRSMAVGTVRVLGAVQVIPAVRVRDVVGDRSEHGIVALQTLIERRFDPTPLFGRGDLLEEVILASGGNIHDLLRLVGEVIRRAQSLPVTPGIVSGAIDAIRAEFIPIADIDLAPLARVAARHELSLEEPGQIHDLSRWSRGHLVIQYRNGREWYDVHPLVRDIVLDRARVLAESAEQARTDTPAIEPVSPSSPRVHAAPVTPGVLTPEMRLTIRVESYRALRRVRWTLPRGVSALVGPNGSGKTTLLDVPELLRHALQHEVTTAIDARGGPGNLRNVHADRSAAVVLGVEIDDLSWQLDLSPKGGLASTNFGERASVGNATSFDRSAPVLGLPLRTDDARPLLARFAELPDGAALRPLVTLLEGYRFYQAYDLVAIRLNGSQVSSDEHLHPDGRNVFSVLRN
ncbi:MAG: hypothetical protein IT372_22280 [Polyangiaceae bacterium]|nr:hypothetical protein [Polyangiaceae bacterium]